MSCILSNRIGVNQCHNVIHIRNNTSCQRRWEIPGKWHSFDGCLQNVNQFQDFKSLFSHLDKKVFRASISSYHCTYLIIFNYVGHQRILFKSKCPTFFVEVRKTFHSENFSWKLKMLLIEFEGFFCLMWKCVLMNAEYVNIAQSHPNRLTHRPYIFLKWFSNKIYLNGKQRC